MAFMIHARYMKYVYVILVEEYIIIMVPLWLKYDCWSLVVS